jgi:HSP20 family molecular chaperone IbpA
MPKIEIEHMKLESDAGKRLLAELNDVSERIRRRAYELFEARGAEHGSDLGDWLRAEGEFLIPGSFEVEQTPGIQRFRLSVPGFDRKDFQVCILDSSLVVTGKTTESAASSKTMRRLLYRWPLPEGAQIGEIVVDGKGATLEITVPVRDEAGASVDKSAQATAANEASAG